MKYEAVIYDLDGTLMDTRLDVANAVHRTIAELDGKPMDNETIYKHVGHGLEDLVEAAVPGCSKEQLEHAIQYFTDDYYDNVLVETDFYPGALEMVKGLKAQGVDLAVFTNKPHYFTLKMFKELQVMDLFKVVLGAEHGYPHKPDRKGTDFVLESLACEASKTLLVGDTEVDLDTALAVGMDCALLSHGYGSQETLVRRESETVGLFDDFKSLRRSLNL